MRPYYGRMESEVSDDSDDYFEDSYIEEDLQVSYVVETHAYCGMTLPHGEYEDLDDAFKRVNERIKWLDKQGSEVYQLNPYTWEVGEPENCHMVPDFCGTLIIKEVFK